MTKTEFFKIMRQQPIHADAFIDVWQGKSTFLNNPCNPNASLTAHRNFDAASRMVQKLAAWLEEFRAIELAHAEALEMNDEYNHAQSKKEMEETAISLADIESVNPIQYGYRPRFEYMGQWEIKAFLVVVHAEALEINTQVDSELAKLCRVVAGVNRSEYKDETKRQLIGASCRGLLDGLRDRLGVVLSRDMLPELTVRAAK